MEIVVVVSLVVGIWVLVARNTASRKSKQAIEDATRILHQKIDDAALKAEDLALRGAIFAITTEAEISGYHLRELGWVRVHAGNRSDAEAELRFDAADLFKTANVVTKLTKGESVRMFQRDAEGEEQGDVQAPSEYHWEGMANEAIPIADVDASPRLWSRTKAVLDGSNIAHWDEDIGVSLSTVKAVIQVLRTEGVGGYVFFDANIIQLLDESCTTQDDVRAYLGQDFDIEIVPSGVVADRKIIELAEQIGAPIVTNDLFRDSIKARHIPKRRGFSVEGHTEVLEAR